MDKLTKLLTICKTCVRLTVNAHHVLGDSANEALEELYRQGFPVADEVYAKIVETDTLIDLECFNEDPVFFTDAHGDLRSKDCHRVLHYDLIAALDEALESILHPSWPPPWTTTHHD
jgi:hypothetical protein